MNIDSENIKHTSNTTEVMKDDSPSVVPPALIIMLAVASGMAVGNLYWAQPLLAQITHGFGIDTAQGGFLIMATQIGYALGLFFIVPLGDVLHSDRAFLFQGCHPFFRRRWLQHLEYAGDKFHTTYSTIHGERCKSKSAKNLSGIYKECEVTQERVILFV